MKNFTYLFVISILIFGTQSCKKKGCMDSSAANYNDEAKKDDGTCVYTPIITLNGAADTTISVATEWTDPGATAANIDGAIVAVTDNSTVDAGEVGVYEVTYTATNDNGTSTVVRTVHVVVNQDTWLGDWGVSDDCGGGTGLALNTAPTIVEGGSGDQILITDFFSGITGSYGTAICQIDGNQVTIASASDGAPGGLGDINYEGINGVMSSNGLSFTITFIYQNTTPLTGGSGTCTATYSK
jgi:hypothetical protein